jgi:hypothetical protein
MDRPFTAAATCTEQQCRRKLEQKQQQLLMRFPRPHRPGPARCNPQSTLSRHNTRQATLHMVAH